MAWLSGGNSLSFDDNGGRGRTLSLRLEHRGVEPGVSGVPGVLTNMRRLIQGFEVSAEV
ncbi:MULTISPECIES: hypothetical protein [Paenibacillus]|uniref:hypothetical protein n=1 Tax=Paenibacillus TaxID=44249 RepID=UPI00142E87E3|nr:MULTISPECIES: hypothetical protein [Paenibacillus]